MVPEIFSDFKLVITYSTNPSELAIGPLTKDTKDCKSEVL